MIRNKLWYRGDSAELEQYFKKTARWDVEKARFWAATAQGSVRKMHSGIVSTVVDRYKDIVLADMDAVTFGEGQLETEEIWKKIFDGADLNNVIGEGIKFYTGYRSGSKELRLEETYGYGYIKYRLYDDYGREVSLKQLPETAHLMDIGIEGDLLLAVPLKIFSSIKYKHRGKALFDGKTDVLDGLDEVISQWMDAIRMGRIKRYIPENLIPRDPVDGKMLPANPFDNDFIAIGDNMAEKSNQQVEISQPQISYEAYVSSYASFLDMVLQGIISPSTLGIDLKKTDNAESQREKEKVTLHVRNKIVDALNETLPELIQVVLQCYDLMCGKAPGEYEPTVKFGEYASPDFDTTVETVGKAKQYGVMSLETSVDQLYGDTWTQEEKDAEVERLKTEQGIAELEEPGINQSAGSFQLNTEGGRSDGGDNREKGLGGESGTVQESSGAGK